MRKILIARHTPPAEYQSSTMRHRIARVQREIEQREFKLIRIHAYQRQTLDDRP